MPAFSLNEQSTAPVRFRLWWIVLPLAVALALLAVDATDLDRVIEGYFYDPSAQAFPLRHDPFLEVVLHYWTKYLVALTASLAFAGVLLSFVADGLKKHRRLLIFIGISIGLSTASVTLLKFASGKHCPWDLTDYGGDVPYTKLLEHDAPPTKPGHCFPAGHASTGFALLVFYFVGCVQRNPRRARGGLALGLVAGLLLGFGRMLQGAHFLTHVVWSGIVCWLVILGLYLVFYRSSSDGTEIAGHSPGPEAQEDRAPLAHVAGAE